MLPRPMMLTPFMVCLPFGVGMEASFGSANPARDAE
jgi:hypothetical protein